MDNLRPNVPTTDRIAIACIALLSRGLTPRSIELTVDDHMNLFDELKPMRGRPPITRFSGLPVFVVDRPSAVVGAVVGQDPLLTRRRQQLPRTGT